MKVLVDTHIFLWWLSAPQRLNEQAKKLFTTSENELLFSLVSSWEIVIKHSLGKLTLPEPPATLIPKELAAQRMVSFSAGLTHVLRTGSLPWHHKDPFDRLLVAQAQVEDVPILTADARLTRYDVKIIWAAREPKPVASPRVPELPRHRPATRRHRHSSVRRSGRR